MKFLIDAQLPPGLAAVIAAKGHPAIHVEEVGLRHAPDSAITQAVLNDGYILVTKDRDFASELTQGLRMIWIRTGNIPNVVLFERVDAAWPNIEELLKNGAALIEVR